MPSSILIITTELKGRMRFNSSLGNHLKIMKENLYWLNTTWGCGGILTNDKNIITGSCPLYGWMKGNKLSYILKYLDKKRVLRKCKKI